MGTFVVAATVYVERFLRVYNERLGWGRQVWSNTGGITGDVFSIRGLRWFASHELTKSFDALPSGKALKAGRNAALSDFSTQDMAYLRISLWRVWLVGSLGGGRSTWRSCSTSGTEERPYSDSFLSLKQDVEFY